MTPTRLAVVVPAHNEQESLPSCLESLRVAAASLCSLSSPPSPSLSPSPSASPSLSSSLPLSLEVVVVADACTDSSADLAAAAGATVVTIAARNVGQARAAGMDHALRNGPDGLWLATTDADSRVPANWLQWHLSWARRGADLLAGTVTVEDWTAWPDDLAARYELCYRAVALHAHGANMGVSAEAYRSAGGFPPVRHSEDAALLTGVRASGGRIVADPSCPVVTSARPQSRAPHGFAAHLASLAASAVDDFLPLGTA